MVYFTTNTYTLKREILNFSNKISKQLSKPERKFTADMTYGMLAAGSCLLTDVVDQLHEDSKKINIVDRLSRHLDKGVPAQAASSYLQQIKKWVPSEPVIHIDDSDVVKSGGYKFESLGIVRDDSESTSATELRNRRKGKIKTNVFYKGKNHEAYISHVKVQITASRKDIYLVLVYGITEHPMMLATNKEIKSKEDVIKVARTYFSRWKIEEYFRCKKQMFRFENFRVRKLRAINALNFYITLCMGFLAHMSMKSETNALKVSIIQKADPVKAKVFFCYYRLAKGIRGILSYAKEGVRLWFRPKRPRYRQLCLKLVV